MEIRTKRESTDGYKNGRFGNHLRQWGGPDEALMALGENGSFMVRYRGRGSQGPAIAVRGNNDLYNAWYNCQDECGFHRADLYVSERCPDHELTFQGEICEAPHVGGYSLHWSQEKTFARQALQALGGNHTQGPGAKLLCRQFMDEDSYADLLTLLDQYPLHTVEFSCFSVRLRNLKRNTIFWEVRNC